MSITEKEDEVRWGDLLRDAQQGDGLTNPWLVVCKAKRWKKSQGYQHQSTKDNKESISNVWFILMWRSENNSEESILSLHHVDSGDWT